MAGSTERISLLGRDTEAVRRHAIRRLGGGLGVLAALALCPPAAVASTVQADVTGGLLDFRARDGESNDVTISHSSGAYRVTDTGATLIAGPGCTSLSPNEAVCSDAGLRAAAVVAGDGRALGMPREKRSLHGPPFGSRLEAIASRASPCGRAPRARA